MAGITHNSSSTAYNSPRADESRIKSGIATLAPSITKKVDNTWVYTHEHTHLLTHLPAKTTIQMHVHKYTLTYKHTKTTRKDKDMKYTAPELL